MQRSIGISLNPTMLGRKCKCDSITPEHYLLSAAQSFSLKQASERRHAAGRSLKDSLAQAQAAANEASFFFQQ